MGMVPPRLPFRKQAQTQPKEGRSDHQEETRVYGSCEECQSIYELESGHACSIHPPQGGDATLPVSPYTGEPYDPDWGYQRTSAPRIRFDPNLIGKEYR